MPSSVPVSFEFFPPRTEAGYEKLFSEHNALKAANPEFFSVTYGAGGSTQERTIQTVIDLNQRGVPSAPHLSCIGTTEATVVELLDRYREAGIRRIVALRGDLPSGMGGTGGDFRHASDLVQFIRTHYNDTFTLEVAAYPEMHPQAPNFDADIQNFITKAKAGADRAITQYFYNADAYRHFVREVRARGCDIDIVPGIMPITNVSSLIRFSDACGADIPRWLRKQLEACGDDSKRIQAIGQTVVTNLCRELLDSGAPGLHFYTLNRAEPSLAILDRLG
ncbi:methylenetetrahydrofolate reductase [NAD(P)H] [Saccharospirillum sp. MSK14-1]|uniref:methylenetetrahydrofolate reductase [NAD(P)H] n=1 Tax=Saccharospirillum sp. MSK14-1 TaxID=1897632 RepID=UPI000D33AD6B|nr:methylenetetrahydrofolate reductase [NAD(P)H] [Saccharospirillum sp. MSK14-1]PTY37719.1 methylenetetrahydrofolate reductase [NAD(P)H] [Saccharospirillum sp. MSK14-1]